MTLFSFAGHSCDLGLGDHESTESQEQAGLGGRLRPVLRPQCLREADIHHQMVNTLSYSGGDKTSVKTLTAYNSHNKAKDPINLGAK